MKNTEFTALMNEVRTAVESARSNAALLSIELSFTDLYKTDKLTGRQFDLITGLFNDLKQAKENAEYEAAKKGNGGKQMSEEKKVEEKPEVVKGEVIDTKNEKLVNDTIGRIAKKVESIGKGYISIVGDVARLYDLQAWKVTGHKNIYKLCEDKFGMARGTVANLRAVFERYGDKETYKLTDECEGMSLREMLAQIASEKVAEIEDKQAGEGEGNGEGASEGKTKGKKVETLVNISFDLATDDWNAEAVLNEILKQLKDAGTEFPEGATVTFTLTK